MDSSFRWNDGGEGFGRHQYTRAFGGTALISSLIVYMCTGR
jgi:hypothetical protein